MEARDLMSTPVTTIQADLNVEEAAEVMLARQISCLPVLDSDNRLVGIVTHSDFCLHRKFLPLAGDVYAILGSWATPKTLEETVHEARGRRIGDVMTQPVITVEEDTPTSRLADLMISKGVNHLPVMRDGQIVGIITRHDLLKLLS